ncbi:MAG: AAA family ATPase [Chloroflexi bacterium]|nr:AAA family ATPase [Chloroflexota bacterium]
MNQRVVIVLTGGPGGGKTTLLEELARDSAWANRFVALPEVIFATHFLNITPREKLFQRVMVNLENGMEDAVARALGASDPRAILCHRGTLDPLAYWLDRGWAEEEFFAFTETRREEHYRRYTAVIHLVTAADGAPQAYKRFPEAHRPEKPEDAIRLDRLLEQVWRGHPRYFRIDNVGKDWAAKSKEARKILKDWIE